MKKQERGEGFLLSFRTLAAIIWEFLLSLITNLGNPTSQTGIIASRPRLQQQTSFSSNSLFTVWRRGEAPSSFFQWHCILNAHYDGSHKQKIIFYQLPNNCIIVLKKTQIRLQRQTSSNYRAVASTHHHMGDRELF